MKEFIDKLIERLNKALPMYASGWRKDMNEIVKQLAEEYNKKKEHEVWLNGCDDDTIFTMEMTNSEYEFLKRVSELANETSTYGCMPRLFLDNYRL